MIRTENLTKQFNDHLAVDRLTLAVNQGEVFGFLGPNGAGKTTTIRMLTCLIAPSMGSAEVLGFRIGQDDQEIRRNVGILTETPGLYDRLSALHNLTIYARLYEVEDPASQCTKYLTMLGLWERRNEAVGTFSKGMRQKLAIARALLHEPKVLFLDEPTSGLDPEAAKLVRDFILELTAEGRTIFLCTHNLDEAERLCDRIAVFNRTLKVVNSPTGLRRQLFGRQVVVHLDSPGEPYLPPVAGLPYVKEAEAVDNKLVISLEDPERHNPEIIQMLVEGGARIQFVGEIRHTLEDVYLHLVD